MGMNAKEAKNKAMESMLSIIDIRIGVEVDLGNLSVDIKIPSALTDSIAKHYNELGYNVIVVSTYEYERMIEISWDV